MLTANKHSACDHASADLGFACATPLEDIKVNANDRKEVAKAVGLLQEAQAILEQLATAEQDKFDNMSEGLQSSERGQAIEAAANTLAEANRSVETALEELDNIEQ